MFHDCNCLLRMFTVALLFLIQYVVGIRSEWQQYSIDSLPSPPNMQMSPLLKSRNTPHQIKFDPNYLPMFYNQPYILVPNRQRPLQKRLSGDTSEEVDFYSDPLENNLGLKKRGTDMPYSGFLKRQFGRDSASLRFGKRAFSKQFQNFL